MDKVAFIFVVVGMVAVGYFIMKRIDRFIGDMSPVENYSYLSDTDCLVMLERDSTNNDYEELFGILNKRSMTYEMIYGPDLLDGSNYNLVLAISSDDLNNLMICTSAKHRNRATRTIALCNDHIYEPVFRHDDVDTIVYTIKEVEKTLPVRGRRHE